MKPYLFVLILTVLILSIVKKKIVAGTNTEEAFSLAQDSIFKNQNNLFYVGDILDSNNFTKWVKDNLKKDYLFVQLGINQYNNWVLSTTIWVAYRNYFKKNEFSNIIIPYVINWKMYSDPLSQSEGGTNNIVKYIPDLNKINLNVGPISNNGNVDGTINNSKSIENNAERLGASPIYINQKFQWPADPSRPFFSWSTPHSVTQNSVYPFNNPLNNKKVNNTYIYKIDSVKRLSANIGNIPFIKNQNQEFADLFEVRMKLLK